MRLLWLLAALLAATWSYRLNVPRVLLPFHPTIPIKFVLEVSQPTGGCFYWRSTRPDVVSVAGLGVRHGECSDRAEVRVTAKQLAGEMTAVIFADDKNSGTTLSCGVSVDQIATIKIETTTKVLFVDAAPVRMVVEAFNAEGDHFSTLSEIPLEWDLAYNGGDRPLRIVQFEQSAYDAPAEILALEKGKKKGYVILLEGTATGSATLSAKFTDPQLVNIPQYNLDLTVVANLLLIPSHDLYVYPQTIVPFQVIIVKQHSQEVVPMPSSNYYLNVEQEDICSLDVKTSSVQALVLGKTSVVLLSQNVDLRAKTGLRPPSTVVNVVDPDSIQWSVSGMNWILQKGKNYRLNVNLLDSHGNNMYISDNMKFDSFLDESRFAMIERSLNSSYFLVTPKKAGKTTVKSRFTAVTTKDGKELFVAGKIAGEQLIEIVDPIEVIPPRVVIPYIPKEKTTSQLKAIGGTGSYEWTVEDSTICNVDKNSGLLTCSTLGTTRVTVTDRRNDELFATAEVMVINPLSAGFGETVKEAEIGTNLVLNVDLKGAGPNGAISFTDCRQIRWQVRADDGAIFEQTQYESTLPTRGTGCGTVELRARSVGDTVARISFDRLKADVEISAYAPLKASLSSAALALGSEFSLKVTGGPRPWLLDPSEFFQKGRGGEELFSAAVSFISNGEALLQCGAKDAQETVRIVVGNGKSATLPLPMVAEIEIVVCCATPAKLSLSFEKNKCHAVPPVALTSSFVPVQLTGFGLCGSKERKLDSISGLQIDWSLVHNQHGLASLDSTTKLPNHKRLVAVKGKPGIVTINAEVGAISKIGKLEKKLGAVADLSIVEPITSATKQLVIWNEKGSSGSVELLGGSGQFTLKGPLNAAAPFTASLSERLVTVLPKLQGTGVVRVTDDCLPESELDIMVRVTRIDALSISAPPYVEVGSTVDVLVEAIDETGTAYPYDLSETKLSITNRALQTLKRKAHHFVLSATEVGSASLSATAKSSSGTVLSSRPHTIQVYSPISFEPKLVTLIPESTFQLEVVGGPLPTPPIEFSLNNSKIADVASNALISSKNLGYTEVTGSVSFAAGHSSKDTVIVRVVSLAGVSLRASSQVVERGSRLWVTVQGKDELEVPFSFGGAQHPFKITWTVDSPEVLTRVHPFGQSVVETPTNQYSIWLDGQTVGTSKLSVKVELSPHAKQHFVGSARIFEDSITITVEDRPSMIQPQLALSTIRIGPNAVLPLQFNLPRDEVEYMARQPSILSVSPTGVLRSSSVEGIDTIAVRRSTAAGNESVLVPVVVSSPAALDVLSATSLTTAADYKIYHLPVGAVLNLDVFARDFLGRRMDAIHGEIRFRPHRFDLTETAAVDNSRQLAVTLRASGETVLKIWDAATPSTSPVYVRISAGEAILPPGTRYSVSEVVCLKSPLQGISEWFSTDAGVQFLDAALGVVRFSRPGLAHFSVKTDAQTLHAKVPVDEVSSLLFDRDVHAHVSNLEGQAYAFPLRTSNSSDARSCTEEQKKLIAELRPPVECSISFSASSAPNVLNLLTVKAAYSTQIGSYVCVVSKLEAGQAYTNLVDFPQTDLIISAKWHGYSRDVEDSTQVPFHPAVQVLESEIRVSNAQPEPSIVSISAAKYQSKYISAAGCEGDLLNVYETSRPSGSHAGTKFYAVKLNVKHVALWNELSSRCSLTVRNSLTGQTISIPVRVKMVGSDMKQVVNALDSNGFLEFSFLLLQRVAWIIPSMMWTCLIGILVLVGYMTLKKYIWESSGTFQDESLMRSPASSPSRSPISSLNSSMRDPWDSFASSSGSSPRMGATDNLWTTSPRVRRRL